MSITLRSATARQAFSRRPRLHTTQRDRVEQAAPPGGKSGRNEAIDILRGYCIVMMIASHTGPESLVNGGVHFLRFVSGAEGFVFLAGLVMGIAYRRKLDAAPAIQSYTAIWRRAGMIWAVHCVLVLGALAANRLWLHYSDLPDPVAIGIPRLLWLTATLQLQPAHGLNVLPLYVFLMGAAPIAFELIRRGKTLFVMAVSAGLFVYSQWEPGLGSWTHQISGGTAFPVPAWQVLFFAGICVGYHRAVIRTAVLARRRSLMTWTLGIALAVVAFAVVIQSAQFQFYDHFAWDGILWERHPLRLGRVLYFLLSVSSCYLLVQAWISRRWLPRFPLDVMATLGRNSLYAFLVHLMIAFVLDQFRVPLNQWLLIELVPLSTLAAVYLMARLQFARRWIPN